MNRLIDDKEATVARLYELYGRNAFGEARFDQCIEELYAPISNLEDKKKYEDNYDATDISVGTIKEKLKGVSYEPNR